MLNVAKAGRTILLKWRITDANRNPVTDSAEVSVSVVSLACEEGENCDPVEEHTVGKSGLQNLGDGDCQWTWKTSRSYPGLCKTLKVDPDDGGGYEHLALFQFR